MHVLRCDCVRLIDFLQGFSLVFGDQTTEFKKWALTILSELDTFKSDDFEVIYVWVVLFFDIMYVGPCILVIFLSLLMLTFVLLSICCVIFQYRNSHHGHVFGYRFAVLRYDLHGHPHALVLLVGLRHVSHFDEFPPRVLYIQFCFGHRVLLHSQRHVGLCHSGNWG